MLYICDFFKLLVLAITNLDGVIDNATDELVGGTLAPYYFIEELFMQKYRRVPFTKN